ncbi:hypothetical protein LINGRAHAP2_LOCUS28877 [Linum grandiflorum]
MAGKWEVGLLPKSGVCSLKDQLVKATLLRVRSQGHPYVELRTDGKRNIFFCTLCLAPCYSDSVLLDHLKGNLHTERLSAAKLTLLKPNPWPFSDGVHFFDTSSENGKGQGGWENGKSSSKVIMEPETDSNNFAIVAYGDDANTRSGKQNSRAVVPDDKDSNQTGRNSDILIPGVLIKEEISDLKARFIGTGQIAARFCKKDEISRIWCEWLGERGSETELVEYEYAVVTFSYNYSLARKGLLDDVKLLLGSASMSCEDGVESNGKRKKSFSDPEDVSKSLSQSNQYDSSGEESSASNSASSKLLLNQYDDQFLQSRFLSSKTVRRELRKQQRIAAERLCDICQQKMLPDKDVATLYNMKTGKLACGSRNTNGAFHVFHTSCLILWVLLCEFEMLTTKPTGSKVRRKSRRKNSCKQNGRGENSILKTQISCVFCPECQGTGVDVDGDELEKPGFPLSEMFKYKMKVSDGRRAWMKSPELLENCSMGFHFPSQSEEMLEEEVAQLKLLHFYRADG